MPTAVLAGGGTAGHVNPLLVVAQALRERGVQVHVVGTATGLEASLVPAAGFPLHTVPRTVLPRGLNRAAFTFPGALWRAVSQIRALLSKVQADVLVGFGGYVSAPGYLAARRSTPVVVHEGNALPGWANKLGARWARGVAVTFAHTVLPGAVRTGLPLRPQVLATERGPHAQAAARVRLGLAPDLSTLVVTGGSLGAAHLNDTMAGAAGQVLASGAQILHLTGAGKAVASAGPGHVVREYLTAMNDAYAAADVFVCRAGAGMVCELAALGIAAVYVPLGVGNGEQARNAAPTVAAGGGLLVANDQFNPAYVREVVLPLLHDPVRLAAMGAAAATTGVPHATQALVEMIARVGGW